MPELPVTAVLPALCRVLETQTAAVLQAPPGAGKTTLVPLALLDQPWLRGRRILMLEPRRLAARAAARRMADLLGEAVGGVVGYRVRLDSKVSARTRIEVVTEGVLTRMIQDDPELAGVGVVIFDEFHERNLVADLGLALCLECQGALRDDLRLVVMSATLDGGPVAKLLHDAAVVSSEGRAFPVETRYLGPPPARFEDAVAQAVRRAWDEEHGDILVFLPGAAEIRRVHERLGGCVELVTPLYGDLAQEAQDRAIQPDPAGRRKVVLATAIAETSLTIEGIRVVVDGGLMRVPRFEPRSGMTRLETIKVSRASADQRRGRAGRLGPGVCYRLWAEGAQGALEPFSRPEILEADLAPLALDLAVWGVADPLHLAWLDPPPAAAFAQARALLAGLGAVDAHGAVTTHGRKMAGLALHPRLAHMVLKGRDLGLGALACDVAAVLSERDIVKGARDADLTLRLDLLRHPRDGDGLVVDRGARQRAVDQARQWRHQLGLGANAAESRQAGRVLALAYPDRVGQRRPGGLRQVRLANGRGAVFLEGERLAAEEWVVAAHLDGDRREARIFLAAAVDLADIEDTLADQITALHAVWWDAREQVVQARRQRKLGELVLKDEPLPRPDPALVTAAMLAGIRAMGLDCLPWRDDLRAWQARAAFVRRVEGAAWPDLDDAALAETTEQWLAPFLDGVSRRAHLARVDLKAALDSLLPWDQRQTLDRLAPTHVSVPSGSRLALDYAGEAPVLAVRLQEMFGCVTTPTVADGRVPVVLHLLSPARRPVQVTRDLAGFWANTYRAVKKDLAGQYPKHSWPEDPLAAPPTARAKPRAR